MVLDLAKAFEPCGVSLGNALQLPKEDLASVVRILRAPVASAVRSLLLHIVLQDASSEATKLTLR